MSLTWPNHPEVNAIVESFAKMKADHEAFALRMAESLKPHQALVDRIAEERAVFERMARTFDPILERVREFDEVDRFHRKLANAGSTLAMLRQLAESQRAMEKAFAPARELSEVLARVQRFHVPSITLFAPDTAAMLADFAKGSGYHSATYRSFFKIKKAEAEVVVDVQKLPIETATIPSREAFLAGQVAIVSQSDLRASFPNKLTPEGQNAELVASLDEAFSRELASLDKDLTTMLAGAKAAAASQNPDQLRHASASLREFLKNFLISIAPDTEFNRWAQAEQLTEKDAKKLETRIRFVVRNARTPSELSFYQVDVAHLRLLLNHFNEGVHWKTPRFGNGDLPALIRRVEGFAAALIEVHRTYNR